MLLSLAAVHASAQRRPVNDPRIDTGRLAPLPGEIPRIGETLEVSIVNLEVFVTDREGRRVYGLTKDDFEIRENGKLQPISNFAEYRGPERDPERVSVAPPAPAAVAEAGGPAPKRAPRTFVIFIEQQALLPWRRDELFAALHKLVDDAMEPGDQAIVVKWQLTWMTVRQAMTKDRAAIHAALDAVGKEIGPLIVDRAVIALQEIADRKEQHAFFTNVGGEPRDPTIPSRPCAGQQLMEIRGKARAIAGLMTSMGGVEGRKVLLMAARRFGNIAGADCFDTAAVPPDQRAQYATDAIRAQVIDAANANGFTIYPVYAGSVEPEGNSAEGHLPREIASDKDVDVRGMGSNSVLLNESQSLIEIADKTGGMTAWGSDIVKLLPRIDEDLDSYYSLGYRGKGAQADLARKVVVTAKRPGLRVRTRTEVIEKSESTRMRDRVIAALSYLVDQGTLGVRVMTGDVRKRSRNRYTLPIKVQVPIGQLTTVREGGTERGAFSIFVAAGNGEVLFSDVTRRTQMLAIPERELDRAKQSSFTYEVDLTIDPKVNRVAIGVYDEVGRDYGVLRVDSVVPQ
jgi:VWFA-related protein